MKKYLYTLCTVALLGLVTSCVDSFDTTNRNPDKLYLDDIDIQIKLVGISSTNH